MTQIITSLTFTADVEVDGTVVEWHAVLYSQRQLIIAEVVFAQHGRNCAWRTHPLHVAQVNAVRGCFRQLYAATVIPTIARTAMHRKTWANYLLTSRKLANYHCGLLIFLELDINVTLSSIQLEELATRKGVRKTEFWLKIQRFWLKFQSFLGLDSKWFKTMLKSNTFRDVCEGVGI